MMDDMRKVDDDALVQHREGEILKRKLAENMCFDTKKKNMRRGGVSDEDEDGSSLFSQKVYAACVYI